MEIYIGMSLSGDGENRIEGEIEDKPDGGGLWWAGQIVPSSRVTVGYPWNAWSGYFYLKRKILGIWKLFIDEIEGAYQSRDWEPCLRLWQKCDGSQWELRYSDGDEVSTAGRCYEVLIFMRLWSTVNNDISITATTAGIQAVFLSYCLCNWYLVVRLEEININILFWILWVKTQLRNKHRTYLKAKYWNFCW